MKMSDKCALDELGVKICDALLLVVCTLAAEKECETNSSSTRPSCLRDVTFLTAMHQSLTWRTPVYFHAWGESLGNTQRSCRCGSSGPIMCGSAANLLNLPQRERLPRFQVGISVIYKVQSSILTGPYKRFVFPELQGVEGTSILSK